MPGTAFLEWLRLCRSQYLLRKFRWHRFRVWFLRVLLRVQSEVDPISETGVAELLVGLFVVV